MKYSEIKSIIKILHENDWHKDLFFGAYRKTWRNGNMGCTQIISIPILFYSNVNLEELLQQYEDKADLILNKTVKTRC